MSSSLLNYALLYVRALYSIHKAKKLSDTAIMFNRFGRKHGWKLIKQFSRDGLSYLINPVSSVRYFELPFALSALQSTPGKCLDVSSPSLFSFYVIQNYHPLSIRMINPDQKDIENSARVVRNLKLSNIWTECAGVHVLADSQEVSDSIWAISVVEHIAGQYDDSRAFQLMYDALAEGGRLILTVPVDRQFWEEYRERAYYGIPNAPSDSGKYFFQRYYDKASIWRRLIEPISVEPSVVHWFGEKSAGHFAQYEKKWLKEGWNCTFNDPLDISENYQEFQSWEEMPGKGVCGLILEKPSKK